MSTINELSSKFKLCLPNFVSILIISELFGCMALNPVRKRVPVLGYVNLNMFLIIMKFRIMYDFSWIKIISSGNIAPYLTNISCHKTFDEQRS